MAYEEKKPGERRVRDSGAPLQRPSRHPRHRVLSRGGPVPCRHQSRGGPAPCRHRSRGGPVPRCHRLLHRPSPGGRLRGDFDAHDARHLPWGVSTSGGSQFTLCIRTHAFLRLPRINRINTLEFRLTLIKTCKLQCTNHADTKSCDGAIMATGQSYVVSTWAAGCCVQRFSVRVPREQKILKGHLLRLKHHQVY